MIRLTPRLFWRPYNCSMAPTALQARQNSLQKKQDDVVAAQRQVPMPETCPAHPSQLGDPDGTMNLACLEFNLNYIMDNGGFDAVSGHLRRANQAPDG